MDRVTELIVKLRDTDRGVRSEAVKTLCEIKDLRIVPALMEALRDKSNYVRYEAATALGEMKDPRALSSLVAVLQNTDGFIDQHAAVAEGQINASRSVPALRGSLMLQNWNVAVVRALGQIKDPRAIPALVEALQNKDGRVRWHAATALRRFGTSAVPDLIEALSSRDEVLRRNAAEVLGEMGATQAIPSLVELLGRECDQVYSSITANWDLLRTVAKALCRIAASDPTPMLRSALPILRRLRDREPGFQEALDQIEAATAGAKDLPLPAYAPPPDTSNLPRPAVAAPLMSPDTLPVPAVVNTSDCPGTDTPAKSRRRWWFRREKGR